MGSPVSHSKYRTSQLANLRIKNLVGSMRKRTPCIVVLPAKSIISMCHGRLRWRLCAMTSLDLRQTLQPHLTFDLLSPVHTNNNVEATLDFVEMTKCRSTWLPKPATKKYMRVRLENAYSRPFGGKAHFPRMMPLNLATNVMRYIKL